MRAISTLRLPAPAKLNLMLRVLGRRTDGYHLLQTVFQFIDYCDWIRLKPRADGHIILNTPLPGVAAETDLTVRAARALRAATGCSLGVEISIEKHLPMGGGLGGGSSDCATTLLGLNRLWSLQLTPNDLAQLGATLGADVPIFIFGQSAWAEGIGERLTALALPEPWYVIVIPRCQVPTGAIFAAEDLTRDHPPITIGDFLEGRHENHLQSVVAARFGEVARAIADLARFGEARLTGSGACVFAEFTTLEAAQVAARALSEHWDVRVTRGLNRSPLHLSLAEQQSTTASVGV